MGKDKKKHKREWESDESESEKKSRKKAEKKVAKVAKMLGYSNNTNPFGDANLLQPFVWGKKKEQEAETVKEKKHKKDKKDKKGKDKDRRRRGRSSSESSSSSSDSESSEDEEAKRLKLLAEIEKVRKRRQDREEELAEIERLRDEEQRLKELAAFGDWQQKEEEFHLEQTAERSKIRLMEFREHAVDLVVKNLLLIETAKLLLTTGEVKKMNPDDYGKHCTLLGLEAELRSPSEIIDQLGDEELAEIQRDIENYAQLYERRGKKDSFGDFWKALLTIVTARKRKQGSYSALQLHTSIVADVQDLLHGKSFDELNALESEIRGNLGPGKTLDVEYWELMLQEVQLQRAKAEVQAFHLNVLKELLQALSQLKDAGIVLQETKAEERRRPREEERVVSGGPITGDSATLEKYLREMSTEADFEDSEAKMIASDEFMLPTTEYTWEDKYRPRKPRYFNRVKTGYDRNKYNLTHYDHDNPPPKVIQGYKFTLFYPDLIDKTQTPRFYLEPCPDAENNEFVIIRFHAGPPYEDVAFKIVNKEWDKHKRAGFVSVFDRGILQLNFNFKRAFYRR